MKKLPSVAVLRSKFTAKRPETVSGDPSDQWYFMLADGSLVGVNLANHFSNEKRSSWEDPDGS